MTDDGKHYLDAAAAIVAAATISDILPSIAALFTVIWTGLRIIREVKLLIGGKG